MLAYHFFRMKKVGYRVDIEDLLQAMKHLKGVTPRFTVGLPQKKNMLIQYSVPAHLTYCTNIHPGESWEEVFASLKRYALPVKEAVSPDAPFGIGLRLSGQAARDILMGECLAEFKDWLAVNDCYVFTMNGFPYGGFHHTVVKGNVHAPDWLTQERVTYTCNLFSILAELLPEGMEGGISTSPISYKPWHLRAADKETARKKGSEYLAKVILHLYQLEEESGKFMHLDIEPEPDGILENTAEMVSFYENDLLPVASSILQQELSISPEAAEALIRRYIQLCYDVCHFAVEFEDHHTSLDTFKDAGIAIGKVQISAALAVSFPKDKNDYKQVVASLSPFNESTYLHQVIGKKQDGTFLQYPDLPPALKEIETAPWEEWRTHFHVPLFIETYGLLRSTQKDILEVFEWFQREEVETHWEVETYTWDVLPADMQLSIDQSIIRELDWVTSHLNQYERIQENSRH